jgi:hypothetical protein
MSSRAQTKSSFLFVILSLALFAPVAIAQRGGGGHGGGGMGGMGARSGGMSSGFHSSSSFSSGARSSSYGSRGFSAPTQGYSRSYSAPAPQRFSSPSQFSSPGRSSYSSPGRYSYSSPGRTAPSASPRSPANSTARYSSNAPSWYSAPSRSALDTRGGMTAPSARYYDSGRVGSTSSAARDPFGLSGAHTNGARSYSLSGSGVTGPASARTEAALRQTQRGEGSSIAQHGTARTSAAASPWGDASQRTGSASRSTLSSTGSLSSSTGSLSRARGAAPDVRSNVPAQRMPASSLARGTSASGLSTTARSERSRTAQRDAVNRLTRLNGTNPQAAHDVLRRSEAITTATSVGVKIGVGATTSVMHGAHNSTWWCNPHSGHGCHPGACCGANWWWGCSSFWWPWWGPFWGFAWGFWWWGSPYYADPYAYSYAPPPVYYSTIVYPEQQEPVHEAVAAAQPQAPAEAPAPAQAGDNTAHGISELLAIGDVAFHERRYSDAVFAYAKAVELAPKDGVLRLIFSDALFAAGAYHDAASALRRALELDPKLVASTIDKHALYADASELDHQLAALEDYVQTHFSDDDARLLLAANDLFAGRASRSVDILTSPFGAGARESNAGKLILARAEEVAGAPAPK